MPEYSFDRLTRRARQALQFAHEEAQALNHSDVGAEHMLLGLVREGAGVAAWVLDDMGVRLDAARDAVAALGGAETRQRTDQHLSSSARSVIVQARQEADQLGHAYVGTEHLLLGMVHTRDTRAAEVLVRLGACLEQVRDQVMDVVSAHEEAASAPVERAVGAPLVVPEAPPVVAAVPSVPSRGATLVGHGRLTTHVLDTAQGRPATQLHIEVWWLGADGNERTLLKRVTTNRDGRTDEPLLADGAVAAGVYELVFALGDYFLSQGIVAERPLFLDRVPLRFGIADPNAHYHVPLLASPWAYSTYRGS